MAVSLGLLAGLVAGQVHFWSLNIVTRRLVAGDMSAVVLQLLRFVVLGTALYGLASIGALVLISAAFGILLARSRVLSKIGRGS
jgi:F1F0 ATPase subunit 2